jgi:uridine kinase
MSRPTISTRKGSLVEEPIQKIIVGVAGGSAAGKTTLCENIYRQMAFDRNFKVEIISLDSFYKSTLATI